MWADCPTSKLLPGVSVRSSSGYYIRPDSCPRYGDADISLSRRLRATAGGRESRVELCPSVVFISFFSVSIVTPVAQNIQ